MNEKLMKENAKLLISGNKSLFFMFLILFYGNSIATNLQSEESLLYLLIGVLAMFVIEFMAISITIWQTRNPDIKFTFDLFSEAVNFDILPQYLKVNAVVFVKTMLWTCLFIIPGIVKAFEYAMIPFDVVENPGLTTDEYFQNSKIMMTGHKFELFALMLSFFGWVLLAALTLGILYGYVQPYMYFTRYQFYLTLQDNFGK